MVLKHNRYTRIGDTAKFEEGHDRIFKPKTGRKVLAKPRRSGHKKKTVRT